MNLETLLEAANYLDCEKDTSGEQKYVNNHGGVVQKSCPSTDGLKRVSPPVANQQLMHEKKNTTCLEGQSSQDIVQDRLNSKKEATITAANTYPASQSKQPDEGCRGTSYTFKESDGNALVTPSFVMLSATNAPVSYVQSTTKSSNMYPLLARAQAAVENVRFSEENERTMRTSVGMTPSGIPLLAPRVVQVDPIFSNHQTVRPLSTIAKTLPSNMPQNVQWVQPTQVVTSNSSKPAHATVQGTQQQMDLNILLPSLVKTSEEEKMLSGALQMKHVKRGVTLTHNQLEKNRRAHLKECFEALKTSIPRLGVRRSSNLTILKAALRHIQILKRKADEYKQTMEKLSKEKEAKASRALALFKELTQTIDKEKVDKYIEEAVASERSNTLRNSLLDDGQQSTSTASEAEEEEFRAALASGEELDKQGVKSLQYYRYHDPSTSTDDSQIPSVVQVSQVQKPRTMSQPPIVHLQQRSETKLVALPNAQGKIITQPKYLATDAAYTMSQALRLVVPQSSSQLSDLGKKPVAPSAKKSPIKLYGQPSGRSATPEPSSNMVPLFPRFSIGSGGSPPLLTSQNFDSADVLETTSTQKQLKPSSIQFPSYHTLNVVSNAQSTPKRLPCSETSVATSTVVSLGESSKVSPQLLRVAYTQSNQAAFSDKSNSLSTQSSSNVTIAPTASTVFPRSPVSMPVYSGYEVKVKYLNQSTNVSASSADQAHIPMKKRHLNVESFTAVQPHTSAQALTRPKPQHSSRNDSEPQMTSLYVGASAAVLGQMSTFDGLTTTSDNESDHDSSFRDVKRMKPHHHWRKNLVNERTGKEWKEYRAKSGEKNVKKRPLQLHQYETPQKKALLSNPMKPSSEASAKPKATFNLWDRKHHAITMTTATNWRGKQQQQLFASSKPKPSPIPALPSSSSESISVHPTASSSITKVSYSLLQQAGMPAVPSALVVGKSTTPPSQVMVAGSQISTNSLAPASSSFEADKMAPEKHQVSANGIVQLPSEHVQPVQMASVQLPGNQIGYQIVQPSPVSLAMSTPSLAASTFIQNGYSKPPAVASPMVNYVAMNSIGHQAAPEANAQHTRPGTSTPIQQNVIAAAQGNAVQMPFMMPTVIPVMLYPGNMAGNVAHNGLQLAGLPPHAKLVAPSDMMAMSAVQLQQPPQTYIRVAAKQPTSPALPPQPPVRSRSTDSASSATLSVDSTDVDGEKAKHTPKKTRLSSQPQSNEVSPAVTPHHVTGIPFASAPQFVLPGNSGFVMAPSSGNGYTIPLNFLRYPYQAYPNVGGAVCSQAVQMAGLPSAQAIRNVGQVWQMGQAPITHCDTAVTMTTTSSANHRAVT